jgi:hypothetical protein
MSKNRLGLIMRSVVRLVKAITLLPLWLIVLPIRRDHVFRHHDWTLRGMGRGSFRRQTYVICAVCWLLFACAVYYAVSRA